MKLATVIDAFVDEVSKHEIPPLSRIRTKSLDLLTSYLGERVNDPPGALSGAKLQEFVGQYYLPKYLGRRTTRANSAVPGEGDDLPTPAQLLDSLEQFFGWADRYENTRLSDACRRVLVDLVQTLPRAVEITRSLSDYVARRGGPFSFPEFLTSFEAGGHSQYDIDIAGDSAVIEGHFKVVRVEGSKVEAEEMISEERVWPVLFPKEVARLLAPGFVLTMEVLRVAEGWEVADAGLAYPPGTFVV